MPKKKPLSDVPGVRVSPMTLACPLCKAKPGKVCQTLSGGELEIVHVARLNAAVSLSRDIAKGTNDKQRDDRSISGSE